MSATRAASSVDVRPAQVWRASRGPVIAAVVLLVLALVIAIATSVRHDGDLDPRSASPGGSRALATLLREQGVQVDLVTTNAAAVAAATAGSTVLVAVPDLLDKEQATALRESPADLVLLAPHSPELFDPDVTAAQDSEPGARDLDCSLPAAVRAGTVDGGGVGYQVSTGPGSDAALCYSRNGFPSLVQVSRAGRAVTVVGDPEVVTNDRLDDRGNAALTMNLLGAHPRLVWYLPSLADLGGGGQRSLTSLIPSGVWWAVLQAGLAVLLLALWRGRRLGPVVQEPLPVVVRAAETVEGRARLYRHSRARDRAAAALREGLLARVRPGLGLPRRAEPAAVVDALAARTGRSPAEVAGLLYGAAPPDDPALVRLADELDRLEREVRRP